MKTSSKGAFEGADSKSVVKFTKKVQPRVVLARLSLHLQYNLTKTLPKGFFEDTDYRFVVKFTKYVQLRVVLARIS